MNKTYTIIIVLVLVAGGLFVFGMRKKAEAPTPNTGSENNGTISNEMPTVDSPGTSETSVEAGAVVTPYQPPVMTSNNTAVKEFIISGQNFSFSPSLIAVKKGDKVKITFKNTSGFHDFKIDAYGLATKQSKSPYQEVLEFTTDKAGSFEYYCSVGSHRAMGMKGTLQVTQ